MSIFSRREFVAMTATGAAFAGAARAAGPKPGPPALTSITTDAQPISAQEHQGRLAKLQSLMQQKKTGALLVEAGTTMEYFTGVRWWRSERTTAAVIPASGQVVIVTPFFESPSVRETLKVPGEVRTWQEDESPFERIAGALREHGASAGPLAVEDTTRFFIVNGVSRALGNSRQVVPGEEFVRGCRMFKSPAELALLQAANNVTIAALKYLRDHVAAGMHGADIMNALVAATEALGGTHNFSLVLVNEASAYPHGSVKPQTVHEGSVILIDTGCTVHGYTSDISRTWIFGTPSARQREIWETVKQGQELALKTAKIGIPTGAIDKAVRTFYEGKGWSKDYRLPGTSHRTGHGIGMDVHEAPYLVRNDTTPLAAGMCFSDEPGIYIPGQFGIRLEDCWHMTESGPKTFTPLAKSIDEPI
jgi:Xaa-Pro dipeptidase